jgi:hypothetical protein
MSDIENGAKNTLMPPSGEKEEISEFTPDELLKKLSLLEETLNLALAKVVSINQQIKELSGKGFKNEEMMKKLSLDLAEAAGEFDKINTKISTHIVLLESLLESLPDSEN